MGINEGGVNQSYVSSIRADVFKKLSNIENEMGYLTKAQLVTINDIFLQLKNVKTYSNIELSPAEVLELSTRIKNLVDKDPKETILMRIGSVFASCIGISTVGNLKQEVRAQAEQMSQDADTRQKAVDKTSENKRLKGDLALIDEKLNPTSSNKIILNKILAKFSLF